MVLSELRLLEGVAGLGVSHAHHQKLLRVPVHAEGGSFAVDVRSDSVVVSAHSCVCVCGCATELCCSVYQ